MDEIGSEFPNQGIPEGENKYLHLISVEKRWVLSGRTALAHIADDLLRKQSFTCVALPAYCCGSMVAPFYRKGIRVVFYRDEEQPMDALDRADAVLVMDYFGFASDRTLQFAKLCKDMGKVLIVDATQTAFSMLPHYELADYLVVSHRKWTDSLSASVYCREGFAVSECRRSSERYTSMWRQAACEKTKYLASGAGEKKHFLDLYGKANHLLSEDYEDMSAMPSEIEHFELLDSDWLRQSRRKNGETLIRGMTDARITEWIRPMFSSLGAEDCPLFFPIVVEAEKRAELRKKLIGQDIYCPIHWPIDEQMPHVETDFHRTELSLICDQRYGVEDMKRQISVLLDEKDKGDL